MPNILFDRQTCVTYLYEGLPDKSKIQTNKRLERIEHTETGVRVHLSDGTIEEGDIVIGADGVHRYTSRPPQSTKLTSLQHHQTVNVGLRLHPQPLPHPL
jgi:2-polyprenyl-6-methoxyphenol hydroxylase-like FAD-dependent oxidoreductase